MNKEHEQRLFNQIEEVLHTHEETYELGAWEEFDANRKKSKRKWPLYMWTAAAVVLVMLTFGLLQLTKKDALTTDPIVVKNHIDQVVPKQDAGVDPITSPEKADEDVATNSGTPEYKVVASITKDFQTNTVQPNAVTSENVATVSTVATSTPIMVEKEKAIALKQDKFAPVTAGAYDSLMNSNRAIASTDKAEKKLTYSLVVSPSVGNQKVNLGAGMELSYALGKGVSINSGLLYTAINAKSNGQSLAASNSVAQSASLSVSGIEVPLGIKYQTNGGFYAAAGVSAVGLLNDKLEYSYLQESRVTSTEYNAGIATEVYKVVSEQKTQKSLEPLSNYMGFFNFSAGKKQAFGKSNLNIGPFVKVPFSSVSTERIKLLQGGVKVSFDF